MRKLEVLSPAGDCECLTAAVRYGADAVYLGLHKFGMRATPANFNYGELKKATELAHKNGVKVYLTCNTLPRNNEITDFRSFIEAADDTGIDAAIVADIGLLAMIKKFAPKLEIHMSTQTGIVNYAAASELYNMGAKRVILARELSIDEIAEIRMKTPAELEIEVFVHGAMCVSFSGRCLLSQYLVNRDANRGACAQPCRWGYYLMEEKRPNEFYKIFEDEKGSYILNAKDLCMISHIDKLAAAGVSSLKIEGRAKSSYYVSVITNAYRLAVDYFYDNPSYNLPKWIEDEVFKVSHRKYCTGFFFGNPKECQYYETGGYVRKYNIAAIVDYYENGRVFATQRSKFFSGDTVEILAPGRKPAEFIITELFNEDNEKIDCAPHPMMKLSFVCPYNFPEGSIIRTAENN